MTLILCILILTQIGSLDDASIFFLAGMPKEIYDTVLQIFEEYSLGELKDQHIKKGSLGSKIDLKGNNFKPMRGLEVDVLKDMLLRVQNKEISIGEMSKEAKMIKQLKEVQKSFVQKTGALTWEQAQADYPEFTTAEALDEFVGCTTSTR